jgi:hypothetical protein
MIRVLAILATSVLCASRVSAAEWQFTPTLGVTFNANTSLFPVTLASPKQKSHVDFGATVALLSDSIFGVEGVATYTPSLVESSALVTESNSFALMGNAVVAAPRRWTEYSLRPFVSGGVGLISAHGQDPLSLFTNVNALGWDLGGGAIGFLTQHTGVRLDLRYFSNLQKIQPTVTSPNPHLRYMTFTVGVVIRRR